MNADLVGATGHTLLVASLIAGLARHFLRRPGAAMGGVVLGAALVAVPDLIEPSHITRGWIGDLSAASFLWILSLLVWAIRGRCPIPQQDRLPIALLILAACAVLYPSSLGMGGWDVYRFGFHQPVLPIVWGLVGLGAAILGRLWIAVWIILAGVLFVTELGPSKNFWDGLVDGLAFLLALGYLIARGGRLIRKQPRP